MNEEENKFGPEWEVLELIAKMDDGYEERIKGIVSMETFNWGELIEQSMSHKMFPMICYIFTSEKLFSLLPPFVNQYFTTNYLVNKHKTRLIKEHAVQIVEVLNKNGIKVACTKGVLLDMQLYGNKGYRFLSDVDFLAKPDDKQDINRILKSLGYSVGTVDWKTNTITEMDREQYLAYITTSDKLPEYVIEVDDDIFKYVSVGFVFSFAWPECPYQVDIFDAFNDVLECPSGLYEETYLPSLNIPFHFVYIVMHLYKHAWVNHFQKWRNDVNLVKFADVYHFWNKNKEEVKMSLPDILNKYRLHDPVLWVLYHTDSIFGCHIVSELGMSDLLSEDYLFSCGSKKGKSQRWKGSMRERLWLKDRSELFVSG